MLEIQEFNPYALSASDVEVLTLVHCRSWTSDEVAVALGADVGSR
jgi:hypothetical protein